MYRTLGVMGLLVLTATAAAQQKTLTEQMALQLGLARDPVQQRVAGRIAEAQSDVIAAQIRPNPELSYEREALNSDEDLVEQKLVVSRPFDFSGRRALYRAAADQHLEATRHESAAWLAELTRDIRERYYTALLQQARRDVYAQTQQRIEVLGKALQKRRREGDVSLYDYQRVITERAVIDAEAGNSQRDCATAWQSLWVLLGEDTQAFQSADGTLLPDQPAPLGQLTAVLDQQPALRQLDAQSEAYALQQRAESKTFPDVTLGLGLRRDETDSQSDNGLVFNASIPLPVTDVRRDKRARFEAQAQVARSDYQLAYERAHAELQSLWQEATRYRQRAAGFREAAVGPAQELIEITEAYYRAGEVGILELLDAYRGALEAELTALELEHRARDASIKLDYLTGGTAQ